ncbi:MAG: hypothetical protein BGP25_04945 [Lysobacterales bacterium 63-13]|nr:MAG: hypothetical protein BGP25_04945 [Xanthomonadales bacterium 63-13]
MQTILLAALPPASDASLIREATDWRAVFIAAGIGSAQDWNKLRVSTPREQLWIVAGDPKANDFLADRLDDIAGTLATVLNAPVPLEVSHRTIGVRASTTELWAYRIPRFVVEKKARDYTAHFQSTLDPDIKAKIERKLEASIRNELDVWNRLPSALDNDQPFLVLTDPGRAIPVPAISGTQTGTGKPVTVLVRRQMVFLSYWRFEGSLFLGPLASLGYGRVTRTPGPAMLERATQKALLDIIPTDVSSEVHS